MKRKSDIFSIEEIISIEGMGGAVINKDGSKVAYQITSTDWKKDSYIKELWLYDVKSKKHLQIVSKLEDYVGSPKWSPDGNTLALILKVDEKKEKKNQIFIIDAKSMEKNQVSYHEKGIEKYLWAADGKGFYYTASSPDEKIKDDRNDKYGKFAYIDNDKTNSSLFYINLAKGLAISKARYQQPKDLIKTSKKDQKNKYYPSLFLSEGNKFYIHQISASPDNSKLALVVAPSPSMEDYEDVALFLYDIKVGSFEEITIKNFAGNIHFSPDSTKMCLSLEESWLKNNVLAIYDLATKKLSKLEIAIDEIIYVMQWTDQGMVLYYDDKVYSKYSMLNMDNELETILGQEGVYYHGLNATSDFKNRVHLERNNKTLSELYVNGKQVSNRSAILKGRKLSEKNMIKWQNSDGFEIEGVLSLPKDFDENKKYPLLVIVHGGPTAISHPFTLSERMYPIETFIEEGFITLEPNYRGGAGYGEKFRMANFRNLGVGDYEDVISGVDHLINLGHADTDRVGVMGWSQGGYISAFCTTFSDRFKAISVGAGISNWETYYYNTDIPKFTKEYLDNVPFKDKEIYQRTSPMTHINKAQTPTLIQHGGSDKRVPVANAHELYRSLKELNLDPKMVIYENMGHGPSTPGILRAINRQNLYWFCHHLLGQPLDGYYLKNTDD